MTKLCSIIIPHYNQEEQLRCCLESLKKYDYLHNEVIVVDNGSESFPDFVMDEYEVLLLSTQVSGSPYVARNLGIANSTEENIVLLDVNCEVTDRFLENGLNALRDNLILCGVPTYKDKKGMTSWQRFDYLYSCLRKEDLNHRKSLPATNLFFKRNLIEEIGLFEKVRSLGDIAWTRKAYDSGVDLKICDTVRYYYPFKGKEAFLKKYKRLGGGEVEIGKVKNINLYAIKSFLPPSVKFVKRFLYLNRREATGLAHLEIVFFCWLVKILYGVGAINKLGMRDS